MDSQTSKRRNHMLRWSIISTVIFLVGCGPMINDITTDLENPPVLFKVTRGELTQEKIPYPEGYAKTQRRKYPELTGYKSSEDARKLYDRAAALAKESFEIVFEDPDSLRLQAVAVTRWLRFRDDIAIVVRDLGDNRSVELRSRSRVGQSDLGANEARISEFLKELRQ